MKYNSYSAYVEDAKSYFDSKKDLKIPAELMILPENLYNVFGGIIEFGPGSKDLVNKPMCKCKSEEK